MATVTNKHDWMKSPEPSDKHDRDTERDRETQRQRHECRTTPTPNTHAHERRPIDTDSNNPNKIGQDYYNDTTKTKPLLYSRNSSHQPT